MASHRTTGPLLACLLGLLAPGEAGAVAKHEAPIPAGTVALMAARDTTPGAPILLRAYKKEAEIEVWKRAASGRYVLLKTFPVCRWSGQLGPKQRTGDRQTPEGFYSVGPAQLNPNSSYYLSFNVGYPNAYDRAHGGTGSHLMVHGTCSSMGCFAMTDRQVGEIYALAREAFAGGQSAFQFQSYPFRMTAANMARYRTDKHIDFWRQLKEGSDRFEATGEEPAVGVSGGRYVFAPFRAEAKEKLARARLTEEAARTAALVEEGRAAVRTTYSDGGMHPSFALLMRQSYASLGEVSRPEALALAGRDVTVIPARLAKPDLLIAALPPVRPTEPGRRPAGGEPSLFAAMPLGAGPGWHPPAFAALAGAARVLPGRLAPRPVTVASAGE